MKRLSVLVLALITVGCASAPYSVYYSPNKMSSDVWLISGHAELDARKDKIIITINKELAITGMLTKNQPKGHFIGSYQQQPLSAECSMSPSGLVYDHQCIVFVDGKYAAQLKF